MNTGVITLLKDFFFEIQPHINGHKTAMGKFFKALEILESKPQSEPLPDSNFEQDFKELNRYLDILCQRGHNVKDSGHLWIEFTDKFNAFRKRVLAAASTVSEAGEDAIEVLKDIMLKFGNAHDMLAKSKLTKEEYQPISSLLAKGKIELFNFYQLYRKQSKQ